MKAVRRPCSPIVLTLVAVALGACVDPHWDAARWPALAQGRPQPRASSPAAGVELVIVALDWEPQLVGVELELRNTQQTALDVDPSAILLAWDGLEYPPAGAANREGMGLETVEPGASLRVSLRYQLGRPLASEGARLVLRRLERPGATIIAVPSVELPACCQA